MTQAKCEDCGGNLYGAFSVHTDDCPMLSFRNGRRVVKATVAAEDIVSGHRDAPDCNCIACAIERGEERT